MLEHGRVHISTVGSSLNILSDFNHRCDLDLDGLVVIHVHEAKATKCGTKLDLVVMLWNQRVG